MAELIKPKEIVVADSDGTEKTFTISKVPAVDARKILAMYPVANMPKLGSYETSEEAMLLLMKYVAVTAGDRILSLSTRALIDNHVTDGEQLVRLEFEMLRYNTSFFQQGGNSGFLETIIQKFLPLIIQTATDSLQQSSPPVTRPSRNSNRR